MQKILAIVGATASGKSALGVYLAQKLGGEIVSADSRQIYKGMRVISRAEKGHMVGVANPARQYSAGTYVRDAKKSIATIYRGGRTPIVVGGTGFYIDALLRGIELPHVAPNAGLRAALAKKTPAQLLAQLKKLDPKSAARVDPHNPTRLVRAIEIATALGRVPTLTPKPTYDVLWLGLPTPPAKKYGQLLAKGVEARLRAGMLREAATLRKQLSKKRFRMLGFEFALVADYLDKKISKQELVEKLVCGEQHYAKRQHRWFKRRGDIHWVTSNTEALRLSKKFLSGR